MQFSPDILTDSALPLITAQRGTIDKSFLNNVQNTFGSWGLSGDTFITILATLSVVFIVGGCGILVNHYMRSRKKTTPPSWIVDPGDIANLFDSVMVQRSKIELRFGGESNAGNRTSTACSLEDVRNGLLELEISGFVKAHQGWLERPVECFFRITNPARPGHSDFYTFSTRIKGIRKVSKDVTLLSLPVPDHVELSQKRLSLRIEPPLQYTLGLALWPDPLSRDGKRLTHIKDWGRPPLLASRDMTDRPVRIMNISSGGMRLELPHETVKQSGLKFEIGERYVVMAQLFDPEASKKVTLWSMVRVQNRYEEFDTKRLEAGVQFVERGRLLKEGGGEIVWRTVDENGIPAVGNWVARRHLQLYREKGLT